MDSLYRTFNQPLTAEVLVLLASGGEPQKLVVAVVTGKKIWLTHDSGHAGGEKSIRILLPWVCAGGECGWVAGRQRKQAIPEVKGDPSALLHKELCYMPAGKLAGGKRIVNNYRKLTGIILSEYNLLGCD